MKVGTQVVAGLDIGTAKVTAVIAEISLSGPERIRILGTGVATCRGLSSGVVVDVEATSEAISHAVGDAEMDRRVESVYIAVSGEHIGSQQAKGMARIESVEVSEADVRRAADAAQAVPLGENRVLHFLPQQYLIDQCPDVHRPIGLAGQRIEVEAILVTADPNACRNIEKCVHHADLRIEEFVLGALAASLAVLNEDERSLGACVIDIGAGTTDVAVYRGGTLRQVEVVPVGGNRVTQDIAQYLRTPVDRAEELKLRSACAYRELVGGDEMVQIAGVGNTSSHTLARSVLAGIAEERHREILEEIGRRLTKAGHPPEELSSIVLTGGGGSIHGLKELTEEVLHCATRIGEPLLVGDDALLLQDASASVAVGLLRYARQTRNERLHYRNEITREPPKTGVVGKAMQWIRENF